MVPGRRTAASPQGESSAYSALPFKASLLGFLGFPAWLKYLDLPKCPKYWPNIPKIRSVGSLGSIFDGILEVQLAKSWAFVRDLMKNVYP